MRISIFPLPGAILFPGLQLPLHIFEPRYRALVTDALAPSNWLLANPAAPARSVAAGSVVVSSSSSAT